MNTQVCENIGTAFGVSSCQVFCGMLALRESIIEFSSSGRTGPRTWSKQRKFSVYSARGCYTSIDWLLSCTASQKLFVLLRHRLVSRAKKVFREALARSQRYQEICATLPFLPEAVPTRWGTSLNADHFVGDTL